MVLSNDMIICSLWQRHSCLWNQTLHFSSCIMHT